MHVLIVTVNAALATRIGEYLENQGDEPDFASDGTLGLRLCEINHYNAVVVDNQLPAIHGTEFCLRLRAQAGNPTPVLILTERDSAPDRIRVFEAGADACMTQPVSLREFYLRLQVLACRRTDYCNRIFAGDIHMDLDQRQVCHGTVVIELAPIGFRILELLVRDFPRVVTRAQIEQAIWGEHPPKSDAALRGHMHRLRRILEYPLGPYVIKTVHGVGYQLVSLE